MKLVLSYSLLAFLVGILLNLTPCVVPVIPLKIQAVLRELKHDYFSRMMAAIALILGSLLFFLPLAGSIAYFSVAWGEIFQSHFFLAIISAILFLAAIATLRHWNITLPQAVQQFHMHRYLGAFFTGFLAAVLATPCSGPFLGSVLAYALTQPPFIIFLIFSAISFGLSFPYVLMLIWPKLLGRVAYFKSWSPQVTVLMSFILFAGSVFFAQALIPSPYDKWLWWLLSSIVVVWSCVEMLKAHRWRSRILPIILIALTLWIFIPAFHVQPLNWKPYSQAQLIAAKKNQQMVLIEFTADWCLNCKVLEKTTYSSRKLLKAVSKTQLILLQVDMTNINNTFKALLERVGGNSLPFAVLLDYQGNVIARLPGMVTAEAIVKAITAHSQK